MEKILEPGEDLPADWPVAGTTGYDAMREVNGLFVDHDQEPEFTELYQRLTGDAQTIAEHIEIGKRMVVERAAARRAAPDGRAGPGDRRRRRGARPRSRSAFEVYRSYLPAGAEHLDHALAIAAERRPGAGRRPRRRSAPGCTTRPTSWPSGCSS